MKCGQALGAGASGYILTATGFEVALEGRQTAHALFMMRILLACIPILGLLLSLYALHHFRLTQDTMHEIRLKLEARRGKV